MSLTLSDIPFDGGRDDGSDCDENMETSDLPLTKEELINRLLNSLEKECYSQKNLVLLMKVAEEQVNVSDLEKDENNVDEALLYLRQMHCQVLIENEIAILKELAERVRDKEAENPDFLLTTTWKQNLRSFGNFINFVSFTYLKERFDWKVFFKNDDNATWKKRLENYRHYTNNEFEFSSESFKIRYASTAINDRGNNRMVSGARVMLILLEILTIGCYKEKFVKRIPRINRRNKRPPSYPLTTFDINKCLKKVLNDNYNPSSIKENRRNVATYFTPEDNVFYILLTDLSKCLKFLMGIKLGIRLASINNEIDHEKSLKVNDIEIVMVAPNTFRMHVFVKKFKTDPLPLRFVNHPDYTTFDLNTLMVIYLANRNLFIRPLKECLETGNFELKSTNEYLFPAFDNNDKLQPMSTFKTIPSRSMLKWFRNKMNVPQSYINGSSTRKGYFVTCISNILQCAPFCSTPKLYNLIISRSGWKSNVCWQYGKSPRMNINLIRNIYAHRVIETMKSGDAKISALEIIPTATTVALNLENFEDGDAFKKDVEKEKQKHSAMYAKYEKFIGYIDSLGLENLNNVTSQCLNKMKATVTYNKTHPWHVSDRIQRKCKKKWEEKVAIIDKDKIVFGKEDEDHRQLDLDAIADDPFTSICHVFDKTIEDYDHPDLWCKVCKRYYGKNDLLRKKNVTKNLHLNPTFMCERVRGRGRAYTEADTCADNLVDRRYMKLIFKQNEVTLNCGCEREKCLKFNPEIMELLNLKSLGAVAKLCYPRECSDSNSFKKCLKKIFLGRVRMWNNGSTPSCVHEMFDITSLDFFPPTDEDDWVFVSSNYYVHRTVFQNY